MKKMSKAQAKLWNNIQSKFDSGKSTVHDGIQIDFTTGIFYAVYNVRMVTLRGIEAAGHIKFISKHSFTLTSK